MRCMLGLGKAWSSEYRTKQSSPSTYFFIVDLMKCNFCHCLFPRFLFPFLGPHIFYMSITLSSYWPMDNSYLLHLVGHVDFPALIDCPHRLSTDAQISSDLPDIQLNWASTPNSRFGCLGPTQTSKKKKKKKKTFKGVSVSLTLLYYWLDARYSIRWSKYRCLGNWIT